MIGPSFELLLYDKNNYEDIVFELLGLPGRFFARFALNCEAGVGLSFFLKNASRLDFLFGAEIGITSPVGDRRYGFMNNLATSRILQPGLSFRYFLN